jgi:hypothetical protein
LSFDFLLLRAKTTLVEAVRQYDITTLYLN